MRIRYRNLVERYDPPKQIFLRHKEFRSSSKHTCFGKTKRTFVTGECANDVCTYPFSEYEEISAAEYELIRWVEDNIYAIAREVRILKDPDKVLGIAKIIEYPIPDTI